MKIRIIYFLIVSLLIGGCNGKIPGADARKIPPQAQDRVKKNIEEGRGFTLMSSTNKNIGEFDFASSNELWRASLDTLDFMPLALANYSGGIIVTDWYSDSSSNDESVKISVRFLSNEVRSDALAIKVFYKNCSMQNNCQVTDRSSELASELSKKILNLAAIYEKDTQAKKKRKYINEALRTDENDQ
tara:strand:+ start:5554 stop:6114 length:561 start_codon:yes stop_codon:yes gene_type:complete